MVNKRITLFSLFIILGFLALYLIPVSNTEIVYAPDPEPGVIIPKEGTMFFVGDIMLSRSVGNMMERRNDYTYPFLNIAETIKNVDLAFGNLENPISSRGIKVGSIYSFRADPKVLEGLKFAGFDVLSIANNHIWDYGQEAFLDTLSHLKSAGIDYVGGGINFEDSHKILVRDINGMKVSFLAYTDLLPKVAFATENTPGSNYPNLDQIKVDINKANEISDIVVVSFHWGDEYKLSHNLKQEILAKAVIDSGANLVIGHHPHVIQEVEEYNSGWIAYSLGNFVFDQTFSKETMTGLGLLVRLKDGSILGVEELVIDINNSYQPSISKTL